MGQTVEVLDVREMAPRDRHSRIFETFRGLKPGESFILVNDHEPKPLLYQFQSEHDGEFDWWSLESGPQVWRVQIDRRTETDPNRTVTDFLQSDHRRLDTIFERFQQEVKDKQWDAAAGDFTAFNTGLRKHIRAEEEILFPVFEDKTGMHDAGPTFVMKMEHKDIHELLDKIQAGTEGHNEEQVFDAAYAFLNILQNHNMKEEHILYPESDSFLSDSERVQVVKRAQAL